MWIYIYTILFCSSTLPIVSGVYPCLCSYQLETPVFQSRSNSSTTLGHMFEYDCKPTYPLDDTRNNDFFTIQFDGQIGYIINTPGVLAIESCPGSISTTDEVRKTTTVMSASTPKPTTMPTPNPTTTSTTTLNPTTPSTTTPNPTTTSTTTQNPTTSSTTTPNPTTTSTTTQNPTTSSTTTPNPTTSSTTTPNPTTTSTTTQNPTTTSTTTPNPTTTSTTTQNPTTTSTTTPNPTTTSTTTPNPTTTPMTTKQTTTPTVMPTITEAKHIPSCPDGWVLYGLSCYDFHMQHRLDHVDAHNYCKQHDSHLININSREEQNTIAHHLMRDATYQHMIHQSNDRLHDSAIWTGGVYSHGRWVWQDHLTGAHPEIHYKHWNSHYPHHDLGSSTCLGIIGSESSTWRDFRCEDHFFFICEKKAHQQIRTTTTIPSVTQSSVSTPTQIDSSSGNCRDGWWKYHNSCYLIVFNETKACFEARDQCSHQHSHLVFIETEAEQQALAGFLNSYAEYRTSLSSVVWTGGVRTASHHDLFWKDPGTHLQKPLLYINWADGRPYHSGLSCIAMFGVDDSKWRDYTCDYKAYYICERHVSVGQVLIG